MYLRWQKARLLRHKTCSDGTHDDRGAAHSSNSANALPPPRHIDKELGLEFS